MKKKNNKQTQTSEMRCGPVPTATNEQLEKTFTDVEISFTLKSPLVVVVTLYTVCTVVIRAAPVHCVVNKAVD